MVSVGRKGEKISQASRRFLQSLRTIVAAPDVFWNCMMSRWVGVQGSCTSEEICGITVVFQEQDEAMALAIRD